MRSKRNEEKEGRMLDTVKKKKKKRKKEKKR